MIIDSRAYIAQPANSFDVCIVGAGAAGITLACELGNEGRSVALVESGGLKFDENIQNLYEMEVVGLPYNPATNRLRYFGGTTNHWSGWCREIDPVEFRANAVSPLFGWPFPFEEMVPHYQKAAAYCEINPERPDLDKWLELLKHAGTDTDAFDIVNNEVINTHVWQYSPPTRFGEKYRKEIEAQSTTSAILNANLINATFDGDRVAALGFRTFDGQDFRIKAKQFVICCGGLENARILLTLNGPGGTQPGNRHGNVGRFFADHVILHEVCDLVPTTGNFSFYNSQHQTGLRQASGERLEIRGMFGLTGQAQRDLGIPNIVARLEPPTPIEPDDTPLAEIANFARLHDSDRISRPSQALERMELVVLFNHIPDNTSRVTLNENARDALGLPEAVLDWHVDERDGATVRKFCETLGAEVARLGIGRVRMKPFDSVAELVRGGSWVGDHHIGTTRIAEDETKGVVDRDLKVFGTNNLFVCGSSVYPSSAASTPTLTIVALASRLSSHLKTLI